MLPVGHDIFSCAHAVRIQLLLQEAVETSLQERAEEFKGAQNLLDYAVRKESQSLARLTAQWAPKRRKVGLTGTYMPDGCEVHDAAASSKLLCDHWAGVFAEKPIDVQKASEFLERYANPFPQVQWRLDKEQFDVVIDCTRLCLWT